MWTGVCKRGYQIVGCSWFWEIMDHHFELCFPELKKLTEKIDALRDAPSNWKIKVGCCYWYITSKVGLEEFLNKPTKSKKKKAKKSKSIASIQSTEKKDNTREKVLTTTPNGDLEPGVTFVSTGTPDVELSQGPLNTLEPVVTFVGTRTPHVKLNQGPVEALVSEVTSIVTPYPNENKEENILPESEITLLSTAVLNQNCELEDDDQVCFASCDEKQQISTGEVDPDHVVRNKRNTINKMLSGTSNTELDERKILEITPKAEFQPAEKTEENVFRESVPIIKFNLIQERDIVQKAKENKSIYSQPSLVLTKSEFYRTEKKEANVLSECVPVVKLNLIKEHVIVQKENNSIFGQPSLVLTKSDENKTQVSNKNPVRLSRYKQNAEQFRKAGRIVKVNQNLTDVSALGRGKSASNAHVPSTVSPKKTNRCVKTGNDDSAIKSNKCGPKIKLNVVEPEEKMTSGEEDCTDLLDADKGKEEMVEGEMKSNPDFFLPRLYQSRDHNVSDAVNDLKKLLQEYDKMNACIEHKTMDDFLPLNKKYKLLIKRLQNTPNAKQLFMNDELGHLRVALEKIDLVVDKAIRFRFQADDL